MASAAQLAPELLTAIVEYLDPQDPVTGITISSFSQCNRLFRAIADDSELWKKLYRSRWRRHRHRSHHVELLLAHTGIDWKSRYAERHTKDRHARQIVDNIVAEPVGRYVEAKPILVDYEMDVFDILLAHQKTLENQAVYEALSEKLWVSDLLDSLRRSEALQMWMQMVASGREISTVAAIGAFSGFMGCDRAELEDKLDDLTRYTREKLQHVLATENPDQLQIARGICAALKDNGISAARPQDFHRLGNHFMNLVADLPTTTLPMTLACFFCAIAQRLGLRAYIVGFPQRILARISGWVSQDGESSDSAESFVLDVFESGRVLEPAELDERLQMIGIPVAQRQNFLHNATSSELVARVARNIITSLQQDDGFMRHAVATSRGAHAAVSALLFIQPGALIDALPNLLQTFPMDVYAIEKDYVPVVLREGVEGLVMADHLRRLQQRIFEQDAREIRPRLREEERDASKGDDKVVEHYIGTVFRHRKWGYTGVIRDWDPRCCADEAWCAANNIADLDNGGAHQPFYSISADDGSERYIAQINIIPMKTVAPSTLSSIIRTHLSLGRIFKSADPERAIFILEEGTRRRFPEDAKWQDDILGVPST